MGAGRARVELEDGLSACERMNVCGRIVRAGALDVIITIAANTQRSCRAIHSCGIFNADLPFLWTTSHMHR